MSITNSAPSEATMQRSSSANKAGYILALVLAVANIAFFAFPTPEGEVGPPLPVLVFGAAAGLAIIAAVLVGWLRGSRAAIRAAAILLVLTAITALPGLVVPGVPDPLRATAAVFVLLTIVAVVLMIKPTSRKAA